MVMEDGGVTNLSLEVYSCILLHEDHEYVQTWPIFLPRFDLLLENSW